MAAKTAKIPADPAGAVQMLRAELEKLRARRCEVEAQPPDTETVCARVAARLARVASKLDLADALGVAQLAGPQGPGLRDDLLLGPAGMLPEVGLEVLLTDLLAPQLEERLVGLVEAHLAGQEGERISDQARAEALARIDRELWELEVQEEDAIRQVEAQGFDLDRRPDASPAIVLGLPEARA